MATNEGTIEAWKRVKQELMIVAGILHKAGQPVLHKEMSNVLLSEDMDTLNRHFAQQTRQMNPMRGPHHGKLTLEQSKEMMEKIKNEA